MRKKFLDQCGYGLVNRLIVHKCVKYGMMGAGTHSIQWYGSQMASGMYFYSLYANGELLTKKMIKR